MAANIPVATSNSTISADKARQYGTTAYPYPAAGGRAIDLVAEGGFGVAAQGVIMLESGALYYRAPDGEAVTLAGPLPAGQYLPIKMAEILPGQSADVIVLWSRPVE